MSEVQSLCCFVFPDVYSYDEDDMVLDSKLPEHLAHFGIDMMTMEKVSFVFLADFILDLFTYRPIQVESCQISSWFLMLCIRSRSCT